MDGPVESSQTDRPGTTESPRSGTAGRLFSVACGLLAVHVQLAQTEIAEEQARLARGLALLVLSWLCLLVGVLLSQAIVVISLHDLLRLRWLLAVAVTAMLNLVVWGMLHWLGARQLHAPVLPATRALLRKTVSALRD